MIITYCDFCGKEIQNFSSSKRNRIYPKKFCSISCKGKYTFQKHHDYYKNYWLTRPNLWKWKGKRNCKYCHKEFEAKTIHQDYCSEGHRKYAWKKNHWEHVKKIERIGLKRRRKENPEPFRFRVRTREALRRESSGLSGKPFNRDFTLKVWEGMKEVHNYTCLKCGKKEPEIKLTVDHIFPLSKGGKHIKENIQPLCFSCNSAKKDRFL